MVQKVVGENLQIEFRTKVFWTLLFWGFYID